MFIADLTIATPEILDGLPANTTVPAGSQVVMQCRVRSKVMPTIKWFRKQEHNDVEVAGSAQHQEDDANYAYRNNSSNEQRDDDAVFTDDGNNNYSGSDAANNTYSPSSFSSSGRLVQFLDSTYENIQSAGERGLPNDTYLSKLIFHHVRAADAGSYVCVAINYRGYTLREAVLEVCPVYDDENDVGGAGPQRRQPLSAVDEVAAEAAAASRTQMMLLFLIPLGLAAMPMLMWGCYLLCRSREEALAARRAREAQQHAMGRKYSLVCQNEIYV